MTVCAAMMRSAASMRCEGCHCVTPIFDKILRERGFNGSVASMIIYSGNLIESCYTVTQCDHSMATSAGVNCRTSRPAKIKNPLPSPLTSCQLPSIQCQLLISPWLECLGSLRLGELHGTRQVLIYLPNWIETLRTVCPDCTLIPP